MGVSIIEHCAEYIYPGVIQQLKLILIIIYRFLFSPAQALRKAEPAEFYVNDSSPALIG